MNSTTKHQRIPDPTRNGEDFIGDTTGMTGVTTGSAQQTSATKQDDQFKDHDNLPGSTAPTNATNKSQDDRAIKEAVSDKEYNKTIPSNMSDAAMHHAADIASEKELTQQNDASAPTDPEILADIGADMDDTDTTALDVFDTTDFPNDDSYIGENSVSGTNPDPSSDDDTLKNAHEMGMQLEEDTENPEELDIARDIDEAEESIRSH